MSEDYDDSIGRVPPQDLEAERGVIGAMMLEKGVIDEVTLEVDADDFYNDANRIIYSAIVDMHNRGGRAIDIVTVKRELESTGKLEEVGGPFYLKTLVEDTPFIHHAAHYARIVRDKHLLRDLVDATRETLAHAYGSFGDVRELIEEAERRLFKVTDGGPSGEAVGLDVTLEEAYAAMMSRAEDERPDGVHTGLTGLDSQITGFRPSEFLVLAARPAMGKTALMLNMAIAVAKKAGAVLVFSLEQSRIELSERLLSAEARVDSHKMRQGDLTAPQQYDIQQAIEKLSKVPLFIADDGGVTVTRIAAICRRMARQHDLKLVIIDYLQLIEVDKEERRQPREQQVAAMTRRLKLLAKDLGVTVIALAQLNRSVESREDKRPKLSDLRESGAIEQDADIVMFLHRPEAYDPEDRPGEADLIVAKNRAGQVGTVPLAWLGKSFRFSDRELRYVDDGFGGSLVDDDLPSGFVGRSS